MLMSSSTFGRSRMRTTMLSLSCVLFFCDISFGQPPQSTPSRRFEMTYGEYVDLLRGRQAYEQLNLVGRKTKDVWRWNRDPDDRTRREILLPSQSLTLRNDNETGRSVTADQPDGTVGLTGRQLLALYPESSDVTIDLHGDLQKYSTTTLQTFEQLSTLRSLQAVRIESTADIKLHPSYFEKLCECRGLRTLQAGDLRQVDYQGFADLDQLRSLQCRDVAPDVLLWLPEMQDFESLSVLTPTGFDKPVTAAQKAALQKLDGRLKALSFGSGPVHSTLVSELASIRSLEQISVESIEPPMSADQLRRFSQLDRLVSFQVALPNPASVSEQELSRYSQVESEIRERAAQRNEERIKTLAAEQR